MPEAPDDLLAQADRLERQLRDQQAELVAKQENLDHLLRDQAERRHELELQRFHAQGEALCEDERLRAHEARVFRWLWRILAVFPIIILILSLLDVEYISYGIPAALLLAAQAWALARRGSSREREISRSTRERR